MKKFLLGLICGIAVTATSAVYASDAIQTYLFPVTYVINGESKQIDSEYATLNYNGHAYVPVRWIAENMGLLVNYKEGTGTKTILIDDSKKSHVAVNESIMSTAERKKLDSSQREWIALLDDYQYYFNLQTNKDGIYNGVNYGLIETSIPFGVGILSIVVTDVPPYIDTKRDYSFDVKVHVELKHSQKDQTPYISEDTYFRFIYGNDRWYINLWAI